jgi:hypothetical protein
MSIYNNRLHEIQTIYFLSLFVNCSRKSFPTFQITLYISTVELNILKLFVIQLLKACNFSRRHINNKNLKKKKTNFNVLIEYILSVKNKYITYDYVLLSVREYTCQWFCVWFQRWCVRERIICVALLRTVSYPTAVVDDGDRRTRNWSPNIGGAAEIAENKMKSYSTVITYIDYIVVGRKKKKKTRLATFEPRGAKNPIAPL